MDKSKLKVGQKVIFDSPYVGSKIEKTGVIKKLRTRDVFIHKDEIEIVCYHNHLKEDCVVTVSPRYITEILA